MAEATLKNRQHQGNWYGYLRWKQLAELFHCLESTVPGRFLIVRYEDLAANPAEQLERLFQACDLPFSCQVAAFINRSCSMNDGNPYGVLRDGSAGSDAWQFELDPAIVHGITHDLSGTMLEHYLEPRK